jgi:hypothetical protein
LNGKAIDRRGTVDDLSDAAPVPADYYRRLAARVRRLAAEATTPAIKAQLQQTAHEYERLAERVGRAAPPPEC